MPFTDQQLKLLLSAREGNNVFVQGSTSSGKSYMVKRISTILRWQNKKCFVLSATKYAAAAINGLPIFSLFKLNNVDDVNFKEDKIPKDTILKLNALIIDDIQSININFFANMELMLRTIRKDKRIFGGLQIVLLGDFFSLSNTLDGRYLFEHKIWKPLKLKIINMPVLFNRTLAFNNILDQLRYGKLDKDNQLILSKKNITLTSTTSDVKDIMGKLESLKLNNKQLLIEHVKLFSQSDVANNHNSDKFLALKGGIFKHNASFKILDINKGMDNEFDLFIRNIKDAHISPFTLLLKYGSQVIYTRNNSDLGLTFGDVGIVTGLKDNKYPVVKFESGITIAVNQYTWTYEKNEICNLEYTQFPLRLCWAIDIDKVIGFTISKVEIIIPDKTRNGEVYTLISKARTLDGLAIKSYDLSKIKSGVKSCQ